MATVARSMRSPRVEKAIEGLKQRRAPIMSTHN
jgi:hypothetical protein